jgi:hypothetical protein
MWQLFYNFYKRVFKTTTMLQLMYNVHTCDHDACPQFHHPLWDTFATSFFIMIPINTINMATSGHY